MATQQELRQNRQSIRQQGRMAQVRRKVEIARRKEVQKQQEAIKKSSEQKQNLQSQIETLKKDISNLERAEKKGSYSDRLGASSIKYGKQAELSKLEQAYEGIESGGYYQDLGEVLDTARQTGEIKRKETASNFGTAIQLSKVESPDIPEGAKIISIKDGVITYELPSSQQTAVQQQSLTLSSRGLPESYVGDLQTQTKVPIPKDPRTGKPYGTVEAYTPPTTIQRYGQLAEEVGYVKAIPKYIGERLQVESQRALEGDVSPFTYGEARGIASGVGKAGEVGTYFIPYLGEALLIGGGVESVATPAGRERLATLGEYAQEQYGVPKQFAYALPAAEIALGAYGLKGTRVDPTRPIIRREPIPVDVEYNLGYARAEGASERIVTRDAFGKAVTIEREIPVTYIKDTGVTGYRTTLTTPLREKFNLRPIYSGLPEEKATVIVTDALGNKVATLPSKYQEAVNLLKKYGYTESQARNALRQVAPQYQRTIGQGEMTIVSREGQEPVRTFTGKEVTSYMTGEKAGVKFLEKKPKTLLIDEEAQFIDANKGIIGFQRLETKPTLFGETLLPTELRTGAGRTTERFAGATKPEYVKEVKPFALDVEFAGKTAIRLTPEGTYARYKVTDVSKKILPSERRLTSGRGVADVSRAEPRFTIYDDTIQPSTGFQGGGKKSSPQFLEGLYKDVEQAKAEKLLDMTKVKPQKGQSKISGLTKEGFPSSQTGFGVGAVSLNKVEGSLDDGQFIGTSGGLDGGSSGLDFRKLGGVFSDSFSRTFNIALGQTAAQAKEETTSTTQGLTTSPKDISLTKTNQILSPKVKTETRTIQVQEPKLSQDLKVEQGLRQESKQLQIIKQTQELRQESLQRLKVDQRLKQDQKQIPPIKPPKKVPQIIPLPDITFKEREKVQPEASMEQFEVFGRRYGKDFSIGEFQTKKEAKEAFVKFLKGTLGRSGFVETEGKRIHLEELDLGFEFRPSKKERGRIVQKARFSLGTQSERREIKSARRNKPTKIKWF